MRVDLRYGKGRLAAQIPNGKELAVLRMNAGGVIEDPQSAVGDAISDPIASPPLDELARGKSDACIVVSDITRPVPNDAILPGILDALSGAGIPPDGVLVLVATGLHRPNTEQELRRMGLDEAFSRGARVENHIARDTDTHTYLGETSAGISVSVDSRYLQAELKILTGLVEPHLMAGYSGGRKAICPGICSAQTILEWHGPRMLEPPTSCQGNLIDNVEHQQALEIAQMAGGADFIVNVTIDEERRLTGAFAGDMQAAHAAAMAQAERQGKVALANPVDIAVTCGGGYPLDLTFYQGVKGIVGAAPIVRDGGTIIIAQRNAEGIGGAEFTEMMLAASDPHEYIQRAIAANESRIDQWQLHVMEKVLRRCEVLNFCEGIDAETQRELFVTPLCSVEEGLRMALDKHGAGATIAAIPEGPYTLVCLRDDVVGSRSVEEMLSRPNT